MPTNNSKLLEKVLSKWAFDELPDNKYNKNQIAIRISEIKEMLLDMEAEAREDQKAWDTAQEEEYTEIAKRKARADTAKQIFKELESYIYIYKGNIAFNLNRKEYEALKKEYNIEE
jgi:hypothetical protein